MKKLARDELKRLTFNELLDVVAAARSELKKRREEARSVKYRMT